MRIVLTGASNPIGKLLYSWYCQSYEVIPISRHHGWDLTQKEKQQELINITQTADIFLNVAHIGLLQGLLLSQSRARINISFSSMITKFDWRYMKNFHTANYVSEKLFLEHVHSFTKNSAVIRISKYGAGSIPSVTDDQIIYAIEDILSGAAMLPKMIEISNGPANLENLLVDR